MIVTIFTQIFEHFNSSQGFSSNLYKSVLQAVSLNNIYFVNTKHVSTLQ